MEEDRKRLRIVILDQWNRLKNISKVAKACKCTRKTVRLWIARSKVSSRIARKSGQGRKRVLSIGAAKKAVNLLLSNQLGPDQTAAELKRQGLSPKVVHRTTLVRAAKKQAVAGGDKRAIYAAVGEPAKEISEVTKKKRLQFCKKNWKTNWGSVAFSDRVKIAFNYPGAKVRKVTWLRKGEKRQATRVNHAKVVNLYAAITKYGVTGVHIVTGTSGHKTTFCNKKNQEASNITSDEYKVVLKTTILPGGRTIFSGVGISTWTLQQDNDPTHRVAREVISEWNSKHSSSVQLLEPWPPNSPDLNPIENVWAYVQKRVNELGCNSFQEFKDAVVREVQSVPKRVLVNLVGSLKKRMEACVEAGGDRTKY